MSLECGVGGRGVIARGTGCFWQRQAGSVDTHELLPTLSEYQRILPPTCICFRDIPHDTIMEPPARPSSALFDVFLRLRPSHSANARFLTVEDGEGNHPTHITIKPPTNDNRKRAIERFAFTRVFEENAHQKELFNSTGVVPMIQGVLGAPGHHGRDGLLATLGVTGSGKVHTVLQEFNKHSTYKRSQSHTILGTKSQRGLVQMSLDVLFQSCEERLVQSFYGAPAFSSLAAADVAEAHMYTATAFLDSLYGDNQSERFPSRAQTPMPVSFFHVLQSSVNTSSPI
jgi:hypothetical protein